MKSSHELKLGTWSARERQILDLLAERKTNGEIAEALGLSFYTAKWHVSEILSKLGVESRDEAAVYWRAERGWRGGLLPIVRGLLPAAAMKWALGASGVALGTAGAIAAIAIVAGSAASVSDGHTTTPTDMCSTQATQCGFAQHIAEALAANDGRALLDLSKPIDVTCPDVATSGMAGPTVFCRGSAPHFVSTGYATGNELDMRLVSATELASPRPADVPAISDSYGSGAFRLASVGCPDPGESYGCDQRFAVAFTWIAPRTATEPAGRSVRIYIVDRSGDGDYLISSQADYRIADVIDAVTHGGTPTPPFGHDLPIAFVPIGG